MEKPCRRPSLRVLPARAFVVGVSSVLVASGCSGSVLISNRDPAHARATERLAQSIAHAEELSASAEERALFVQAESFYRYRFEPPSRSTWAFVAEGAAAVIDIPALQSLAGSLDLLDLRLRSPDAAAQLYETFLARYPTSKLRALALYRIGWVYRSVGIPGLPRESPNEAFDTLIREQPDSPLASVAREAREVPRKSKSAASAWSLIPGLGQFYVGEYGSGAVRVGVALAASAAIAVPIYIAAKRGSDLSWNHDWPLLALGTGGLIILSFDYTSSYEEAMRGVVQWNERAEARFEDAHPDAP
jgi:hypothetical protein